MITLFSWNEVWNSTQNAITTLLDLVTGTFDIITSIFSFIPAPFNQILGVVSIIIVALVTLKLIRG